MNFEVDRYSPAWAHIALCADLTWTTEPPDDFIIANQRLWARHCRISQVLQDSAEPPSSQPTTSQRDVAGQKSTTSLSHDSGANSCGLSAKDVIPESRLAQFYGNFYYDEARERCYVNPNERPASSYYCGQSSDNFDVTECWMLPESLCTQRNARTVKDNIVMKPAHHKVEFWFRKLLDEPADRSALSRRRRQSRLVDDDFVPRRDFNDHHSAASGRCGPLGGGGEAAAAAVAALAARVRSVRGLWPSGTARSPPPPPPPPRKMRARRRQPRRLAPPPMPRAYCIEGAVPLVCDPHCKLHFEPPRPPQLCEFQQRTSRLSASVQAFMRASAARAVPYRGTNVTRYAPTTRRTALWWPREHPTPPTDHKTSRITQNTKKPDEPQPNNEDDKTNTEEQQEKGDVEEPSRTESPRKEKELIDDQVPSTSSAATDTSRKKRLYSTVLSMSAPTPINLAQVRLSQKFVTPGILKLNPKIVLPSARIRPPNVDNKFEELEKEALEQYKPSDESIDTKFHELEKQAEEQYSTSNSNTSCSSENSAEKRPANSPSATETDQANKKQSPKFQKDKSVDSVVIYSQNFPDLNSCKPQTSSGTNLKNFHAPPRGEKKEQTHRPCKLRSLKTDCHRAASDTDYEAREVANFKGTHKGLRWAQHAGTPKKRHLSLCVSDFSSDEEIGESARSIKDASPCSKNYASGKVKMSAHGAGDLQPIVRKT